MICLVMLKCPVMITGMTGYWLNDACRTESSAGADASGIGQMPLHPSLNVII